MVDLCGRSTFDLAMLNYQRGTGNDGCLSMFDQQKQNDQLEMPETEERFGASYWQGCSPLIARGALLTAGQMLGTLALALTTGNLGHLRAFRVYN